MNKWCLGPIVSMLLLSACNNTPATPAQNKFDTKVELTADHQILVTVTNLGPLDLWVGSGRCGQTFNVTTKETLNYPISTSFGCIIPWVSQSLKVGDSVSAFLLNTRLPAGTYRVNVSAKMNLWTAAPGTQGAKSTEVTVSHPEVTLTVP